MMVERGKFHRFRSDEENERKTDVTPVDDEKIVGSFKVKCNRCILSSEKQNHLSKRKENKKKRRGKPSPRS